LSEQETSRNAIVQTAKIVSAYVGYNRLGAIDLAHLIGNVHAAVTALGRPTEAAVAPALIPAVPVKKSVTADYLVCLEDGLRFKSLKRHLATSHQLSLDAYRAKWGLPSDYPMTAVNYAAKRSALAKNSGLGRKVTPAATTKAKGRPRAAVR
jgi:predicted transcriptional regulator